MQNEALQNELFYCLISNLSVRASDKETFRVVKSGGFNEGGTKS